MDACRICNAPLHAFMSFGQMPIANGFLTAKQFDNEYFFPLEPAFCENCCTFQIVQQPDPEQMFHDNYAFFSRTSKRMLEHFADFARGVQEHLQPLRNPFVVEIGSNDGILLEHFAKAGIHHLGCEPSANVAEAARKHGVATCTAFFTHETAQQICNDHGKADAILAANVICHIPDLHDLARALVTLLQPHGLFIFEEPYLGDVIEKTAFDQIYDEHVYLFSLASVNNIFSQHGFSVIDVHPQTTHGGSMRYVLARLGQHPISERVHTLAHKEEQLGLAKPSTYARFKAQCEFIRNQLVELLHEKKQQGYSIAGYGATSKCTTLMNYCAINANLIDYITDTTPIKQHKYTPGSHIQVVDHKHFQDQYPDYAVLFAWNHKDEILQKEHDFSRRGGQWIVYVPAVGVIQP